MKNLTLQPEKRSNLVTLFDKKFDRLQASVYNQQNKIIRIEDRYKSELEEAKSQEDYLKSELKKTKNYYSSLHLYKLEFISKDLDKMISNSTGNIIVDYEWIVSSDFDHMGDNGMIVVLQDEAEETIDIAKQVLRDTFDKQGVSIKEMETGERDKRLYLTLNK